MIQSAQENKIADKIVFLCTLDHDNLEEGAYTRGLTGGGVFLRYIPRKSLTLAEVSDRPNKYVFRAIKLDNVDAWDVIVCRSGVWIDKLIEEYDRVTFRQNNTEVVQITDNFGPMDGGDA